MNVSDVPTPQSEQSALPPRPKRRLWLHVLLASAILAAGIVVGAAGATIIIHRAIASFVHHPERIAPHMMKRMTRELDLSDEQAKQVDAILERRVGALMEIRRDMQPRVAEQLEALKAEMRDVLDDDQYSRWERHLENLENILLHHPGGCDGCDGRGRCR